MDLAGYRKAWLRPDSLDTLNRRIHDGVPVEELGRRAADRRDTFFRLLFPYAKPTRGAKVLELGQGVGWIMEAMLDANPIDQIVGVDISPTMIERARERWHDPRASYVVYDGLRVPFPDDEFDNVYSVACIQHIEKHYAFLVMKELLRVLKPGGHCTLHLLSIHHLGSRYSFEDECWKHVTGANAHWHHYYSFDELFVLLSEQLGVSELDIRLHRTSFWVHFSKGTQPRFKTEDVEAAYFLNRDLPSSLRPRVATSIKE